MTVFENLVVDKSYMLKIEETQSLENDEFAIKTQTKHQALGHVMKMVNLINVLRIYQILTTIKYNGEMETAIKTALYFIFTISERNDFAGAKDTEEKLDCLSEEKAMTVLWTR